MKISNIRFNKIRRTNRNTLEEELRAVKLNRPKYLLASARTTKYMLIIKQEILSSPMQKRELRVGKMLKNQIFNFKKYAMNYLEANYTDAKRLRK